MNRKDMLVYLTENFETWDDVFNAFGTKAFSTIKGWYRNFDGPSIAEMYLTTAHPMGDESGETITINDFNEVRK